MAGKTRCLLIGATGFIGSNVRARLADSDHVDLVTAARTPLAGTDLHLDLATASSGRLQAALRELEPHVVINCAGATRGDTTALVAGNVVAVSTLADAVVRAVPSARLVHLGSAAEYGRVEPGTAVTESARPEPLSAYGVTKLSGTALLRAAADTGLDVVVLRVFNPLGPDAPQSTLPGRLLAEIRRTADSSEEIQVGPLDAHRDFVDVRDVAEAVALAALSPARIPFLLNVGSGRATALRELAERVTAVAGTGARLVESEPGSMRSADVPWQQANISGARITLGWTPAIELETSLRDMWQGAACLT